VEEGGKRRPPINSPLFFTSVDHTSFN